MNVKWADILTIRPCMVVWLLMTAMSPALAQCPTNLPNRNDYGTGAFQIRPVGSSCLPRTILIRNGLEGATNTKTLFDYKGGPIHPDSLTTDSIHTYTRPGSYTIVQFSEKNGRKLVACPKVYVPDTLPPQVRIIPCGNTRAKIVFESSQTFVYDYYSISWGDGTVQEIQSSTRSVSHTYRSPAEFKIQVSGVQKPSFCKSKTAELLFSPSTLQQKPSIKQLHAKQNNQVLLQIDNPLRTTLQLQQHDGSVKWMDTGQMIGPGTQEVLLNADTRASICFRLQAMDTCLIENYQSEPLCIPWLQTNQEATGNVLSWSLSPLVQNASLSLWKDNTHWQELGNRMSGTISDDALSCNQEHCYQLVATFPGSTAYSVILCQLTPVSHCAFSGSLYIPDAFTPNGDRINDYFGVKGKITSLYELTIFNNWGSAIFHSKDPLLPWDGTHNGTTLPAGPYLYKIVLRDQASGENFVRAGTVYLIK